MKEKAPVSISSRATWPISLPASMGSSFRRGWLLVWMAVLVGLAGCAGQAEYKDGMALINSGQTEDGLGKLAEAAKANPDSIVFHTALIRNRELYLAQMIDAASSERSAGHPDTARALYEHVLRLQPDNPNAKAGIDALAMDKRHEALIEEARDLLKNGEIDSARTVLRPVLLENSRNAHAFALQRDIDESAMKDQMAGPALQGKFKKPVTLQFRDANIKMVFEALSRTAGINILLDKDVKSDIKTSIFVTEASVEDTIEMILLQNQLEKKIISDNTVFIYPSTPAKLKDYQDLQIRSFHLAAADAKQMETMLKTLLKTKDMFVDETTNSVVIRDTPAAIQVAEKLIADQDVEPPEVMLEVEVLEVSSERISNLGIQYPQTETLTAGNGTGPSGAMSLMDLSHITTGTVTLSPSLALTLNLKQEDSDTHVLASPRIRARNHEKAKIMIGERVPEITNAVTPLSTGSPVVTGSVQYLDVGLKLEVEPDIHSDGQIAIKIGLEVSSIINTVTNSVSGTLAYEVGTRNANTVLSLKDGETQILAGLIQKNEQLDVNKLPGLGDFPLLGRLFSNHDGDNKKTEVVLSITPHIIGSVNIPDARNTVYWTGTESTLRSDLLRLRPSGTISLGDATPAGAAESHQQAPATGITTTPAESARAVPGKSDSSASPLVLSWLGPQQVKVGSKLSLVLNAQANQSLTGIGFVVNYDPKVLKAASVVEGLLLRRLHQPGNPQSALKQTIDQDSGQIHIDLPAAAGSGASGSGSLVSVLFEALAADPQTKITVSGINPTGANGEAFEQAATEPEPHTVVVVP